MFLNLLSFDNPTIDVIRGLATTIMTGRVCKRKLKIKKIKKLELSS